MKNCLIDEKLGKSWAGNVVNITWSGEQGYSRPRGGHRNPVNFEGSQHEG